MKTLIFTPFDDDAGGIIEFCSADGRLKLKYNLKTACNENGIIYKLYGLCAKKPFNTPCILDTVEFINNISASKRDISRGTLAEHGYTSDDIDTFVIAKKNMETLEINPSAAAFDSLVWDVFGAFSVFQPVKVKNPVEHGREVLESIHMRTRTDNPEIKKIWCDKIDAAVVGLERSSVDIGCGCEWYEIRDIRPPVPLPAYRHLLFVTEVAELYDKNGFYLFGRGKDGHTALAIKTRGLNPFVNADDCAKRLGDYYAVGVYLGDDGQYFEIPGEAE